MRADENWRKIFDSIEDYAPDESLPMHEQMKSAFNHYKKNMNSTTKEFLEISMEIRNARTHDDLEKASVMADHHEGGFALRDSILMRKRLIDGEKAT